MYGTHLLRIRPNGRITADYLVNYLALPHIQEWFDNRSTASVIKSINSDTLRSLPVVLPPRDVEESINETILAFDDKARIHLEISRTTDRMRELLAPLLMSGRLPAAPPHADDPFLWPVFDGTGEPVSREEVTRAVNDRAGDRDRNRRQ